MPTEIPVVSSGKISTFSAVAEHSTINSNSVKAPRSSSPKSSKFLKHRFLQGWYLRYRRCCIWKRKTFCKKVDGHVSTAKCEFDYWTASITKRESARRNHWERSLRFQNTAIFLKKNWEHHIILRRWRKPPPWIHQDTWSRNLWLLW